MDEFEKRVSADYIYAATAAKYGDPLGPTFDMLRRMKSCREIIESASRPIENLDNRLTFDGFRAWYLERAGLFRGNSVGKRKF
mgnify:CR=1 FL=1